jgi:hypothetical protein
MHTASDRPERADRYDRPRFRQDLVAETVDDQGARFIDVMDPDSGNVFRFYEVEYSLACGMDGERDVAGIVKWAQDELGLTPSQHEVRTVIATLGDLGFIDAGGAAAGPPDLAPGVVAAPGKPYPPTDVELGSAGGGPPRGEPLPPVPQFTLGVPGATARRPAESADEIALGAPGTRPARPTPIPAPAGSDATEVSIDLSDHIAVRPDDVKEAVRASKVMAAVDGPPGLFDSLDERPGTKPPPTASRPPEPARQIKPAARTGPRSEPRLQALHAHSDAMPEARIEITQTGEPRIDAKVGKPPLTRQPENRASKPPVELPGTPVQVEKSPSPPAPKSGVIQVLVVVFIVALLGGGGFLAWKYLLTNQDTEVGTTSGPVTPPVKQIVPPPPAPPPPAPSSKIVMDVPPPDDIKTTRAGLIETIVADKTPVKAGEPVVRLVGDRPIEAEIAALTRDEKKIEDLIDAATNRRDTAQGAGNKADETKATAEITDRQKALTAKRSQLATRTTDLAKFLIPASSNGTVQQVAKQGQKVAADDIVARLERDAAPGATFAVTDATTFATNTSVELAVGKGEQHVTCTIADVQPDSIKVTCPADPALSEGTAVTLKVPGTPAETPAPPMPNK